MRERPTFRGNVAELARVSLGAFPLTIPVRVGNDARVCITTDIKARFFNLLLGQFFSSLKEGKTRRKRVRTILFTEFPYTRWSLTMRRSAIQSRARVCYSLPCLECVLT